MQPYMTVCPHKQILPHSNEVSSCRDWMKCPSPTLITNLMSNLIPGNFTNLSEKGKVWAICSRTPNLPQGLKTTWYYCYENRIAGWFVLSPTSRTGNASAESKAASCLANEIYFIDSQHPVWKLSLMNKCNHTALFGCSWQWTEGSCWVCGSSPVLRSLCL